MTATPRRIQRKRTKGWRKPPNTVCVDRSTRWGNRFRISPRIETGHADVMLELANRPHPEPRGGAVLRTGG